LLVGPVDILFVNLCIVCVWYGVAMWRGREALLVRVWGVGCGVSLWNIL